MAGIAQNKDTRRTFLKWSAAAGSLAGLGMHLPLLPPVSASEAAWDPSMVRFSPDIEPLVQLLEDTPRGELLQQVAARIQRGTSYREVLAALLLAGVRNVQPRPSVGFKFHAVLVVNSAHLASLASPSEHRWLPIFWALDYFKSSQARDVREGNWTMPAVDEPAVPQAAKARQAFVSAMDAWDEPAADAAVAGLARTAGAGEIYELFFRYGARDFRSIGHKAIFVANSWRTLQCIGWRHAEPVLRSLAYALLNHEGDKPNENDVLADRPWRENLERSAAIRDDWMDGRLDEGATLQMLAALREASYQDTCQLALQLLNKGVHPQALWDAVFLGSGELLVRQNGIVALHASTTSNAMHFAYQTTASDHTRRMLLLQNLAFLPLFREAMFDRGRVDEFQLEQLPHGEGQTNVESIVAAIGQDRRSAAQQVLQYLDSGGNARELIDAARVMVFLKGNDSHDYKFSSAVMEDYFHVSPTWRNRFLAASVYKLRGAGDQDTDLASRIKDVLG